MADRAPIPKSEWTILGGGRLPVRNIYCVGWNYSSHNREMGRAASPDVVVFQKSTAAILDSGGELAYPDRTNQLEYEAELVVLVGEILDRAAPHEAADGIAGFAAGIDFTRRDLQKEAKSRGQPWFDAKNFAGAAAVGPFVPADEAPPILEARITLAVNGETRQDAPLADMSHPPPDLLSLLSHRITLVPGDIVFTGTPEGVGPVVPGDVVRCEVLPDLAPLEIRVVARASSR